MTITHDVLILTVHPCTHRHVTALALASTPLLVTSAAHHGRPIQTCSIEDLHSTDIWWHVTEAHTVGKWAVRILLETFLGFTQYVCFLAFISLMA